MTWPGDPFQFIEINTKNESSFVALESELGLPLTTEFKRFKAKFPSGKDLCATLEVRGEFQAWIPLILSIVPH